MGSTTLYLRALAPRTRRARVFGARTVGSAVPVPKGADDCVPSWLSFKIEVARQGFGI